MTLNQNDVYDDARKMFRIAAEEVSKQEGADESSRLTILLSCVLNAWVQDQLKAQKGAICDPDGDFRRVVVVGIGQTLGNFCIGMRPADENGQASAEESVQHWLPAICSVAHQHAQKVETGTIETSIYFERTADGDVVRDFLPGGENGARN